MEIIHSQPVKRWNSEDPSHDTWRGPCKRSPGPQGLVKHFPAHWIHIFHTRVNSSNLTKNQLLSGYVKQFAIEAMAIESSLIYSLKMGDFPWLNLYQRVDSHEFSSI